MTHPLRRLLPARFRTPAPVVPVVRLAGTILASGGGPLRPPVLSLASAAPLLKRAFAVKRAAAVAIVVNSPGGSPVQSRLIYRRIRDHAAETGLRVLVFVEDVAASGGYMIACAGDEIIVDPSSVVGSIGVVSGGFGFVEAIGKLGIERRVHTSGENKARLDPFQPERPEDVEHLKALQREVHETFIDLVKASRGSRLKEDDKLFSGLFWSGRRGLELGLVDRLGDLRSELRARFGEKVEMRAIVPKRGLLGRAPGGISAALGLPGPDEGGAGAFGAALAGGVLQAAEERALWARFGL